MLYEHLLTKIVEKYGHKGIFTIDCFLKKELNAIEIKGVEREYYNLAMLIDWLKKEGYPYKLPAGRSLVTYLMDTTSPNPLPAHKYCKHCHSIFFHNDTIDKLDGFDIPFMEKNEIEVIDNLEDNHCPVCGNADLECDGHDLLWQVAIKPGVDSNIEIELQLPRGIEDKVAAVCCNARIVEDKGRKTITLGKLKMVFCLDEKEPDKDYYKKKVDASCVEKALENWPIFVNLDEKKDLPRPTTFSSLLGVTSLYCSTGIWNNKTKFMVEELGFMPDKLVCFQEDIYNLCIKHGYTEKDAYKALRAMRFGKPAPFMMQEVLWCEDAWKLYMLLEVDEPRYIFPKSTILERVFYIIKEKLM